MFGHLRCPENTRRRHLSIENLEDRRLLSVTTSPRVNVSPVEQLMIELINRGRANPTAEAARHSIGLNSGIPANSISTAPKPPLAPNQILTDVASAHSADMLQKQYFSHTSKDGRRPDQRISAAGYSFTHWAENLGLVGQAGGTVNPVNQAAEIHSGLVKSTQGHRQTIFNPSFTEIGVGAQRGNYQGTTALMVTQDFGRREGNNFLTGVAFVDNLTKDNFYTVQWVGGQYKHEGKAGAKIRAVNILTGAAFETTTGNSGGYALPIPDGTYVVTASGGGINTTTVTNVKMQGQNVKLDFGNHSRGSIAGKVFGDINGNGSLNSGEQGLANWTVYVDVNNNGKRDPGEPTSKTNSSGDFTFSNLAAGATYRIRVEMKSGWKLTSQPSVHSVALAAGQTVASRNFGVQQSALSMSLAHTEMREIGGQINATVSRNGPVTGSLVVNLSSSNPSEATVPSAVTIPSGAASATFPITAVHDNVPDGTKTVTINASAAGFLGTSATLTVLDDDILVALDDTAITRRGTSVNIAVLQNDIHPSSPLSDLTVEITSPPPNSVGTLQVVDNQALRFTPTNNFVGIATMHYAIRDPRLGISQPARVRVGVPASAKQNPWSQWDVNGDGNVTAHDALLIINSLNDPNESRLVDELSRPLRQPFLDVNGDGRISAHDALLVINRLNLRSQGEGEESHWQPVIQTSAPASLLASPLAPPPAPPPAPLPTPLPTPPPAMMVDRLFHQSDNWWITDWSEETRRRAVPSIRNGL